MTLVFDYDGTLHDTRILYGRALRMVYSQLVAEGYAEPRELSDRDTSKYLGVNAPDMWNDFMPELPKERMKKASMAIGREMIRGVDAGETRLFDGIPEALSELQKQGYKMVILSNCRTEYMTAHRKRFGLDKWFEDYYCAEAFGFIPKEDIFPIIREKYGDSGYIMVGDRDSDFIVGTKHGLTVIGCAYGFGTEEERSVCDKVVTSPFELPEAISSFIPAAD